MFEVYSQRDYNDSGLCSRVQQILPWCPLDPTGQRTQSYPAGYHPVYAASSERKVEKRAQRLWSRWVKRRFLFFTLFLMSIYKRLKTIKALLSVCLEKNLWFCCGYICEIFSYNIYMSCEGKQRGGLNRHKNSETSATVLRDTLFWLYCCTFVLKTLDCITVVYSLE